MSNPTPKSVTFSERMIRAALVEFARRQGIEIDPPMFVFQSTDGTVPNVAEVSAYALVKEPSK